MNAWHAVSPVVRCSGWQRDTCYRMFGNYDMWVVNGWWERPETNPDRHARIRARHFHHASGHAWTCSVLSALVPESFIRFCDLSMEYDKSFENCAWGVS